ncbi:type II secretion system protein [Pseudoclavibacter sp. CFCC 13796]|uniref:type II secretion system protein n=1 Tax=Pseudoclavibacter sp. CFCC 13796 TaxID=2615179 RepID=UPI00130141BC|nr:type II secretion system protein [Pseudoclavibacter sp. CFCC 13796]KAB1661668.1 type II secretion system protein [Pseudoclavibacter sp. CFCC 13796]
MPHLTRTDDKSEHGFTLPELITVIAISLIIAAVAVPSFLGFRAYKHNSEVKASLTYASDQLSMAKATRSSDKQTLGEVLNGRTGVYDKSTFPAGVHVCTDVGSALDARGNSLSWPVSFSQVEDWKLIGYSDDVNRTTWYIDREGNLTSDESNTRPVLCRS